MPLTRTPAPSRGRILLWAILVLIAFSTYQLIGWLRATYPLDQAPVSAVAPTAAQVPQQPADALDAVRPTGLSAEAEDAAERAAAPADQPPTF